MTFFKAVFYFIILILPTQFLSASTQVDILYSSDADIAGFQFNIENVVLIGASGGEAEENGLMVKKRIPIKSKKTKYNRDYLKTKAKKLGHLL